jgi:hypothetical protein
MLMNLKFTALLKNLLLDLEEKSLFFGIPITAKLFSNY